MPNITSKHFSLIMIGIAATAFVYIIAKAAIIVDKRQIGTEKGIYTNCVTTLPYIQDKANELTQGCESQLCRVQRVLDYVTAIPYVVNNFNAHKPKDTIANNYGDCDDKSNLLISLLHALDVESYFVLVPEHIFVIVYLDEPALLGKKGLYLEGRKFYILESTAKGSKVGFPLHYRLSQIGAIVEPFDNDKLDIASLEYR